MEEYLKQLVLSIMLCMTLVCAGDFDDHERASESTIAEQEEAVMGRELDHDAWYNGACCGSAHQHGYFKHWEGI